MQNIIVISTCNNIKIINKIFDILFNFFMKSGMYFTLTQFLNLVAKFPPVTMKCSPAQMVKL